MKLVTFAVAAYNHEKFVKESLDSVWNDGYPFKQIVIIDDGSTDRTSEIIQNWCEEKEWRGISFTTGPNSGITSTLNKLIAASTGDYIRLVSSDDLLLPGGTEKMVRILDEDKEAMAAFGDAVLIDKDGKVSCESTLDSNGANRKRLANPKLIAREIITNWAVSGPVILIRRDFYTKFGTYDSSLLVDDWDLYLRVASIGGLRFIGESVAKYRIHGSNTSKTLEREKRVRNLLSQSRVADNNVVRFTDQKHRALLRSEKYLLSAKISFLSRRWIECSLHLLTHVAFRFKSFL
jgi:glycosyltransferase involved in cell wall biosynthesis